MKLTEREIKRAIKKIGPQFEKKIRAALNDEIGDYEALVVRIYARGPQGYDDALSWIALSAATNDVVRKEFQANLRVS